MRKNGEIRKCLTCGKEFYVKKSKIKEGRGKYCSRACKYKAHGEKFRGENHPRWIGEDEVIKCEQCGEEFKARPWLHKRFCSKKCKYEYTKIIFSGENNPSWKGGNIKLICEWCGEEFEAQRHYEISGNKKYCSRKCAGEAFGAKRFGENNSCWSGSDIEKICKYCGELFFTRPHSKKQFCSVKCKQQYITETGMFVGNKSPLWKGGLSFEPYCSKFNNEFRDRVRLFFNHTCQKCNHVWIEGEIKLAVHHVNYRKDSCCADDVKPLFVPTCSKKCHMATNHNREYWEKYFTNLINEKYGGKCYFTEEEMIEMGYIKISNNKGWVKVDAR